MITLLSEGGWIGILIGSIVVAAAVPFLVYFFVSRGKASAASKNADSILKDAKIKAEHLVKNAQLDAKQIAFEEKEKTDNEIRTRKSEIAAEEAKLSQRMAAFETRENLLFEKEKTLDSKKEQLENSIASYQKRQSELDAKIDSIIAELEKVSGMSVQEAHDEIMARVESKMSMEIAASFGVDTLTIHMGRIVDYSIPARRYIDFAAEQVEGISAASVSEWPRASV